MILTVKNIKSITGRKDEEKTGERSKIPDYLDLLSS